MKVRVQLLGSGTTADPFRAPCPTYVMHDPIDYVGKVAIIDVPDTDHDFLPAEIAAFPVAVTAVGPAIMGMAAPMLTRWYAKLDGRYVEHAGAFRPVPQ